MEQDGTKKESIPDSSESEIENKIITKIVAAESSFGGVSVRGWVTIALVLAVIVYPFFKISSDVVTTLATAAVGWYFAKNQTK